MPKFKKKPVVIEALQYNGDVYSDIGIFLPLNRNIGVVSDSPFYVRENELYIKTLEGHMHVNKGDWVIKGVHGEYYPCKPDIFDKTYEKVEE